MSPRVSVAEAVVPVPAPSPGPEPPLAPGPHPTSTSTAAHVGAPQPSPARQATTQRGGERLGSQAQIEAPGLVPPMARRVGSAGGCRDDAGRGLRRAPRINEAAGSGPDWNIPRERGSWPSWGGARSSWALMVWLSSGCAAYLEDEGHRLSSPDDLAAEFGAPAYGDAESVEESGEERELAEYGTGAPRMQQAPPAAPGTTKVLRGVRRGRSWRRTPNLVPDSRDRVRPWLRFLGRWPTADWRRFRRPDASRR